MNTDSLKKQGGRERREEGREEVQEGGNRTTSFLFCSQHVGTQAERLLQPSGLQSFRNDPCTGVALYVATGTFQMRGSPVPVQSYCFLLVCTKMASLLCIKPAVWGHHSRLPPSVWGLGDNKTCTWMLGS